MALRKEPVKDCVPSEYQQTQENTQEDDAVDNKEELSLSLLPPAALSRDKRRRERENKPKSKEMTEEEMMDLALRLSEHEASVTASRLKQEEEAMMKAIKESMVSQTQTLPPSQSLLVDDHADVSLQLCSRRKLFHSHGKMTSGSNRGNYCLTETGEAKTTGEQNNNCNKKQKGKEGFLPAMPDLLQTQEVYSRASPCSSESVSVPLDSPQSSDSTQIDDCQLRKSPVFPLTGCRATVCISRLSQELLQTCKTSGFVSCSQDIWTQKSPIVQAKSPTFPKSPMNFPACPNSPAFTDTYQGQDGEQAMSPERGESPVFGRTTQHEQPQSACKPQVCKNSGFMFSSQESLSSTGRSASCRPKSPVFPGSRGIPNSLPETSGISKSPVFSWTEGGPAGQSRGCSAGTVQRTTVDPDMMNSFAVPSSSEPRGSPAIVATSQSLEEDAKTDHSQDDGFKKLSQSMTDDAQVNEASKDCSSADAELTSDMTLLWSDEDDNDVTPTGSPSPVFPEERPAHQASLNHVTAADPETTGANCSSQETTKRASTPCEESAAGPMVHYYWGVPFCPRGLDPDKYTQVILAQMEVYEKSLKQAQRCLLRKAEWGEPVLPQPENSPSRESPAESPQPHNPQRHCLRLRRKKLRGSADVSPGEEVDEKNTENKEEEENNGGGEDNTDDCEVCPETQLSDVYNDSSQDLTVVPDGDAQTQPESRELPEAEMIIRGHSPTAGRQQMEEEMEVDAPVCRETQGSFPACRDVGNGTLEEEMMDPDVEEVTEQKCRRSASPELEAAGPPQSPEAKIDCPICQGSFPATEIEVHAAYCDGEVAIVDERRAEIISLPNTLKPRRKRTRRTEVTDEEMDSRSTAGRDHEKCYVCQKAVPLRDYSHHTEFCIPHPTAKPKAKGNLLSALEQSESRDSDAGPSKLHPGDVIDLRDDEDENDSVSAFRISNSPIRSFTPISEATDFRKHQRSKKPSRRQR